MGYLFLSIALLAGATKGFCGKKTSGYLNGMKGAMLTNILRMLLCILIGFAMMAVSGDLGQALPSGRLLWITALSGVSTAVFVVTWLVAVKKSAYMLLDVFLTMGTLIPLLAGIPLFGEPIRPTQWLGMGVLLVAVMLMCSYNNSIKTKMTLSGFLLLVVSGVANGVTSLSQKLFIKQLPQTPVSVFNFYTYIFAAVTLVLAYFLLKSDEEAPDKKGLTRIAGYVLVMAVCLFLNSYFNTLAANYLDAVLLYPLNQGASLILATLMSAAFFKEKITPKCVAGIAVAFAALIIINVL